MGLENLAFAMGPPLYDLDNVFKFRQNVLIRARRYRSMKVISHLKKR
jgi:hypothetical protein